MILRQTRMKHVTDRLFILAALALAGCSQPVVPVKQDVKPVVAIDPAAAVRAIRAAGAGLDSAVQVHPLRNPAIDGFLDNANKAEASNNVAEAIAQADKALQLAPDAPDILQYLAELETARSNWVQAEKLAIRSFTLGPKVGALCARNWQTVVEARIALNDPATTAQARLRLKECRVPPRLRM